MGDMDQIPDIDSTLSTLNEKKLKKPIVRKLLAAAKHLLFRYGPRKVSIEEICREAGVSKMTFYRHFKDKEDITLLVLQEHFIDRMNEYMGILKQDIPFEDKLKKILDIKIENIKSMNDELLKEILTDKHSRTGKWLTELNIEEKGMIREFIHSAQAKGEIRTDVKMDLVLFMIEKSWDLLSDKKILEMYESKTQMLRELNAVLYYGILGGKTNNRNT
jgi:AcrR family transcriptional regulator